jgi:WD40 repeat protein
MRLAKPDGHLAEINCLAFSSDGRLLVSGSTDATLLVWDVSSGQVVQRLEGHQGFVSACAFLPDGRVLSGGWGGELFVWDRATGTKRQIGRLGEGEAVLSLRARSDGAEVMAGTYYGHVESFAFSTGATTWKSDDLYGSAGAHVRSVGWLDDGRRFGGTDRGHAAIWGDHGGQTIRYAIDSAEPLAGGRLVVGGYNEVAIVAADGHPQRLGTHSGWVYGLAVSPRRDAVLAGDDGGHARVWDLETKTLRCSLQTDGGVRAAAIDATGTHLAIAGTSGRVLIASASGCRGGREIVPEQRLGTFRSRGWHVASGPSALLVGGIDGLTAWSLPSGILQERWELPHAGEVDALAPLAGGGWVAGTDDNRVWLGAPGVAPRELTKLRSFANAIKPAPGGDLWTVDDGGDWTRIRLEDGSKTRVFEAGQPLYALAVNPRSFDAIAGGTGSTLPRLDASGALAQAWSPELPEDSVNTLEYSPDGTRFIEGGTSGQVLVRDAQSGEVRANLTGLSRTVHGTVATAESVWAGGSDRILTRWPLSGGASVAPSLQIAKEAKISGLTITPDGRFLAAALDDGRTAVHALPDGAFVADLIPLRDGSWASIFADGSFKTSATGAALDLMFEDRDARRVARLGGLLHLGFGAVSATRLDNGPAIVRAGLFSPQGPPRVWLDGILVHGVHPSRSVVSAYEVDTLLADPSGRAHRLDAIDPTDAKASVELHPEPFLRAGSLRPRALLIGNSEYQTVRKLPGAGADLRALAGALHSADGWALDDRHLATKPNLGAADLVPTVESFFADATDGETLLLYFAGHGLADGREGYLLPVDYRAEQPHAGALSASALWKAALASKAARVVIVLDACRAGGFRLPETLGDDLENNDRIGLVLAASAGNDSYESPQGGRFTQAFVDALRDPANLDYDSGAVQLGKAYVSASGAVYKQGPRIKGRLDTLPLAWPPPPHMAGASVERTSGSAQPSRHKVSWQLLSSRQVSPSGREVSGKLVVDVVFGDPADAVSIGLYNPAEQPPIAHPEILHPAPPSTGWRQGQEQLFEVPLKDVSAGPYRVEVTPCLRGACEPAARFSIELRGAP